MNTAPGKSPVFKPITLEKIRVYVAISSKGGTTAQIHPSSDCLYLSFRRSIVISTNKLLCLTRDVRPSHRSPATDCVGPMILIGRSSAEAEAAFIQDTA